MKTHRMNPMDKRYSPKTIEPKWQKEWERLGLNHAGTDQGKPKFYPLVEFPYPSGAGLHTGHVRGYTAMDVVARKRRFEGYDVLYPIGWDAFGLPTENYAIKSGIRPEQVTKENTDNFRRQLKSLGFSFDWTREIDTTDPAYYKWTQWIFLKFFENGLAYKAKMAINWCPSCKIGLANEEVVDGKCDRCGHPVEEREKEQWMLAITKYADRLYDDLDQTEYWEKIKMEQRNWIGRSEGTIVKFPIVIARESSTAAIQEGPLDRHVSQGETRDDSFIEVFTTRVDTIFGCTYVVVAPEHPLVVSLLNDKFQISNFKNKKEVEGYLEQTKKKSDLERTELNKEKTGVKLEGIEAINPFTGESVPVFVADYVLGSYGTGAVMAVPAHDERDFEFAKKYGLPIRQSITPDFHGFNETVRTLDVLARIYDESKKRNVKFWVLGGLSCVFHSGIIYRAHSDIDIIAKNDSDRQAMEKILSDFDFRGSKRKKVSEKLTNIVYINDAGIEIDMGPNIHEFGLIDEDFEDEERTFNGFRSRVLSVRFIRSLKEYLLGVRDKIKDKVDLEYLNGKVFTEDGVLVDSGDFTGLSSTEAREKMTAWLEEKGLGKKTVKYKLRDWVFSRQRYWGEPIPLVHCEKCGWVAVPEGELPVVLPKVEKYQPTDTGESPLAAMEDWVATTCPSCGGPARRETDTMPNWAGSSWYFLRYLDPKNDDEFSGQEALRRYLPVDWYNGGMEHTTLHLLYSRFWHKFLYDLGLVPTPEPYVKRTSHGLILAEGGVKMSKSKGNVVNPDDAVADYGADALRVFEMFMGPFDQPVAWNTDGLVGARRFLEKVWKLRAKVSDGDVGSEIEGVLHRTIKKVSEDIEEMRFNTAISALMILANAMEKEDRVSLVMYQASLILFAPFAPHIAEELWHDLGNEKSIFLESWPEYDPGKIVDETVTIAASVNGKVRDTITVPRDIPEDELRALALASEKVRKYLEGKEPKKVIVVPGRIVNIVI